MSMNLHQRQTGAALITALVFLIIITLLSLSAMRSSILELRQASNDEVRVMAFETTQAIIDSVINTPANLPVVGDVGFRICTAYEPDCEQNDLVLEGGMYADQIAEQQVRVRVERLEPLFGPPPRGLGTTARMLTAASFNIEADYDRADEGLGHSELRQGIMVVVPKGQ